MTKIAISKLNPLELAFVEGFVKKCAERKADPNQFFEFKLAADEPADDDGADKAETQGKPSKKKGLVSRTLHSMAGGAKGGGLAGGMIGAGLGGISGGLAGLSSGHGLSRAARLASALKQGLLGTGAGATLGGLYGGAIGGLSGAITGPAVNQAMQA